MKINKVEIVKPELFDAYSRWLVRNLTEGQEMAEYNFPHCNACLYTGIPCVGDVSDSVTNCPVCYGMFFKITDNETGWPVVTLHTSPTIC